MFTGLVDDVGRVEEVSDAPAGRELRIRSRYQELATGESIAVNGACLTVRTRGDDGDGSWFTVGAVVTTTQRTTIGAWRVGDRVNLERAMRLGDRLGGHLVLGHVDGVGHVQRAGTYGDAWLMDVALPAPLQCLMVRHGSVAVDGVSLTVNALRDDGIQLSIIDHTLRHTTLGDRRAGDAVHIEADVIAKHVERLMPPHLARAGAT